jgi:type 1 glutamine amidotransferase
VDIRRATPNSNSCTPSQLIGLFPSKGDFALPKIQRASRSFFAAFLIGLPLCLFIGSSALFPSYADPNTGETPLRVCLISGSNEYHSDLSLSAFKHFLESQYNVQCVLIQARSQLNQFGEFSDLPGLDSLNHADVILLFTRRVTIPEDQLAQIKQYLDSGKPLVAVRTASHGLQGWPEFDKTVLGGNYQGHFGLEFKQTASPVETLKDHPVLEGITKIVSGSSLYKTAPLASDAKLLMVSTTPQSSQPSAWTRVYKGGRIFYTSLGSPEDFKNPSFRHLLTNALFWTAGRKVPQENPRETP